MCTQRNAHLRHLGLVLLLAALLLLAGSCVAQTSPKAVARAYFDHVYSNLVQVNQAEHPGRSRGRGPGVVEGCGRGQKAGAHPSTTQRGVMRCSAQGARN
jgi:hypothetical protein